MSIDHNELLTCREIVRLITDYLEDALPLETRLRFEEHLSLCDGCSGYLDQMLHLPRIAAGLSADELLPEPIRQEFLRAFADWKLGGAET